MSWQWRTKRSDLQVPILHGETSGSHSIYMGRWLILGILWNLHGEIGVLHAIYMGRLSLEAMIYWLLDAPDSDFAADILQK